jgi:hypothetical protein
VRLACRGGGLSELNGHWSALPSPSAGFTGIQSDT